MKSPFSIGTALRFGWEQTRLHSALVFGLVILIAVLSVAHGIVSAHPLVSVSRGIASVLLLILEILVSVGTTIIVLRLAKHEPATFGMVIPPWALLWRYLIASLLVAIIVLCGIGIPGALAALAYYSFGLTLSGKILIGIGVGVACIVGLYLLVIYSMVKFAAIDGLHSVIAILRRSMEITQGARWQLLLFFIVLILLNILGLIVFFVGLLVTIPVTMLSSAYVYITLCARADAKGTEN